MQTNDVVQHQGGLHVVVRLAPATIGIGDNNAFATFHDGAATGGFEQVGRDTGIVDVIALGVAGVAFTRASLQAPARHGGVGVAGHFVGIQGYVFLSAFFALAMIA